MTSDLVHHPIVLYSASAERLEAAKFAAAHGDWVMAVYLAGLSIECLLQAFALRDVPTHDARHDLTKWLTDVLAAFRTPSQ